MICNDVRATDYWTTFIKSRHCPRTSCVLISSLYNSRKYCHLILIHLELKDQGVQALDQGHLVTVTGQTCNPGCLTQEPAGRSLSAPIASSHTACEASSPEGAVHLAFRAAVGRVQRAASQDLRANSSSSIHSRCIGLTSDRCESENIVIIVIFGIAFVTAFPFHTWLL